MTKTLKEALAGKKANSEPDKIIPGVTSEVPVRMSSAGDKSFIQKLTIGVYSDPIDDNDGHEDTEYALNDPKNAKLRPKVNASESIEDIEEGTIHGHRWDSDNNVIPPKHYEIRHKSGKVVAKVKSKDGARSSVDRHDMKHGGYAHAAYAIYEEDMITFPSFRDFLKIKKESENV